MQIIIHLRPSNPIRLPKQIMNAAFVSNKPESVSSLIGVRGVYSISNPAFRGAACHGKGDRGWYVLSTNGELLVPVSKGLMQRYDPCFECASPPPSGADRIGKAARTHSYRAGWYPESSMICTRERVADFSPGGGYPVIQPLCRSGPALGIRGCDTVLLPSSGGGGGLVLPSLTVHQELWPVLIRSPER
jgi:hypothetical protein